MKKFTLILPLVLIFTGCFKQENQFTFKKINDIEILNLRGEKKLNFNYQFIKKIKLNDCYFLKNFAYVEKKYYALDSKKNKVIVYDSLLNKITEFGNSGQGPGEFEEPSSIYFFNDTIFLKDISFIHKFDKNYQFITRTPRRGASYNLEFFENRFITLSPTIEPKTKEILIQVIIGENQTQTVIKEIRISLKELYTKNFLLEFLQTPLIAITKNYFLVMDKTTATYRINFYNSKGKLKKKIIKSGITRVNNENELANIRQALIEIGGYKEDSQNFKNALHSLKNKQKVYDLYTDPHENIYVNRGVYKEKQNTVYFDVYNKNCYRGSFVFTHHSKKKRFNYFSYYNKNFLFTNNFFVYIDYPNLEISLYKYEIK